MTTVHEELVEALKAPQKKGQDDQTHFVAIIKKANEASDKVWENLSKKAQEWVNTAIEAYDNKEDLPTPPGFGTDDSDEAEEEETPKAKTAKGEKDVAKGNGKSKPAAKAAKGKGKAAKEVKAKSGKKVGKGGGGKRARLFKDDQRITVLSKKNPKREGSASFDRFELYETGKRGMTVKQALEAGVTSGDLAWDSKHEYISIE